MFDLSFCYDSLWPFGCNWLMRFVLFIMVSFILYKLITPRIKER